MESIFLIIGPIVTGFITYFFTRRKTNADATNSELDNVAKAIRIWRDLSEDMELRFKAEIEALRKENCDLQTKINQVMEENEELKEQMKELEKENKKLQAQLKIFNRNNPSLEGL